MSLLCPYFDQPRGCFRLSITFSCGKDAMISNRSLLCIIYHVFANFETLNMAVGIATILETESKGKTAKTHLVCLPILTQQQTCLKLLNSSMELQLNISHYMYNYLLVTTKSYIWISENIFAIIYWRPPGRRIQIGKAGSIFILWIKKIYYFIWQEL